MKNVLLGSLIGIILLILPVTGIQQTTALGSALSVLNAKIEIQPETLYVYFANQINPMFVDIYLGNFLLDGHVLTDINNASIVVNDTIVPTSVSLLPSYGDFSGEVLQVHFPVKGFIQGYGVLWDSNDLLYTVAGQFADAVPFSVPGTVTIIGHKSGDANNDGIVNIADATYLISYIFASGTAPDPLSAADVDCDNQVTVGDAVYLVRYIFANGPLPCMRK